MVEILADQFSKVFVVEAEDEIPECMTKKVPVLNNLDINKLKIKKILENLRKHKSPGPDGIHPRIIKESMEQLLEPLEILYQYSFTHKQLPHDWLIVHFTPIYKKKGAKCNSEN